MSTTRITDEEERSVILNKLGSFAQEGDDCKDVKEAPEDSIPDLPENQKARDFLKNAPTKGLHMPLGIQVKVMQCWRCKAYGHRTGDLECPLTKAGNIMLDSERQAREDPMSTFVANKLIERKEKYERVAQLMELVTEIRKEEASRKKIKKDKQKKKRSHNYKSDHHKRSRN